MTAVLLWGSTTAFAQDTTKQVLPDSLRKKVVQGAALRSVVIPGWGQVHNKKYWKAPIALAGVGTSVYFASLAAKESDIYKRAVLYRLDKDTNTVDEFFGTLSTARLLRERRLRKAHLNVWVFASLFSYALNVTDAYTDANMKFSNRNHYPEKAAFYSALLPGAGQWYNRKYWKVPIVYAGLGASIAFIIDNTKQLNIYRDAYILRTDGDPTTVDTFPLYHDKHLIDFRDFYKRNLDVSYIALGAIYILNIIDAIVDAHLYGFDISDDLSLKWRPQLHVTSAGVKPGIGWTLRL